MIRKPYAAGHFYPNEAKQITEFIKPYLAKKDKRKVRAVLLPHAGYVYSGETAAVTLSGVELTERILILGPNHTGLGRPVSVMPRGFWETPLGKVAVDEALAGRLLECPLFEADAEAHQFEHAIEVELPLLQLLTPLFSFVPVTVGLSDIGQLALLGKEIAGVLKETNEDILIITSSDMNHYEPHDRTLKKDEWAIDAMLALDEARLAEAVVGKEVSMCGFLPAYAMLVAIKELGARHAELIAHTTSAPVSGDYDRTVGYAGMVFW